MLRQSYNKIQEFKPLTEAVKPIVGKWDKLEEDFNVRVSSLLLLGSIVAIGCQPVRSVDTTPTSTTAITTEPLSPTPIRIPLETLPPPFATESASQPPQVVPIPASGVLQVPPGFTVNVFAEGLDNPRWLALTPTGEVLVTETRENRIRLLKDTDGDGVADVNRTFADASNGLNIPFGMAFVGEYFYVGNTAEVRRFPYGEGQLQITGSGEKITDLPGGGYNQHWTRNVVVSPDGEKLYVSIGSRSNVDEEELPRASVQVMNLDGSNRETFAFGLRNPVGLDFHPQTGELYTTVNERDGLGDDLVPDYLTRIRQGEFYGWPYTYLTSDRLDPRRSQNGTSDRSDLAQQTRTPDVLFQSHSAALGLQFYDGTTFPQKYQNGAFVAFRGSWNRDRGTGYKVVFVPFDETNRPRGDYEDFLTGFLLDPTVPTVWGRPVGLLVMPDGSLLVTEESNNRIYRIQYRQ
ncbi:MAG: sorbosone dehydrogenase family protein [Geitlerinemataceae cyanobacterium]